METSVYFVTTRNCNLRCAHCYVEAGPGLEGTTTSAEDFRKAIKNLPKERSRLTITGGEILTMPERLQSYLQTIREENRQRPKRDAIEVGVQTNGSWGKNWGRTKRTVAYLKQRGVSTLGVAIDEFHIEQGIKEEWRGRIYKKARKSHILVQCGGAHRGYTFPKGRGATLLKPTKDLDRKDQLRCHEVLENGSFTIREDGRAYTCCYSVMPLPGNLFEESLESIVARSKNDPVVQAFCKGGVAEMAITLGHDPDEARSYAAEFGECALCLKLHGQEQ